MWWRSMALAGVLLVAGLGLFACDDEGASVRLQACVDGRCPAGFDCVDGRCVPETDQGEVEVTPDGSDDVLDVVPEIDDLADQSDRPDDTPCEGVVCGSQCCTADALCQDGACVDVCEPVRAPCGSLCCDEGQVCRLGQCAANCGGYPVCGFACCNLGQQCVEGRCTTVCSSEQITCGEGDAIRCCPAFQECRSDGTCGPCPELRACGAVCCPEGERCEGGVCRAPCDGVRCGVGGELCCQGAETCIFDTCVIPGAPCQTSIHCPHDHYCEPSLGACIPKALNTSICESIPDFGVFTPSPASAFTGLEVNGLIYDQSLTTPVVADIDADGHPDIAAVMYRGNLLDAVLVILDGRDLSLKAHSAVGVQPNSAGLAVAQLDPSTPELEIVAIRHNGGLNVYRHDGSLWWSHSTGALGTIRDHSAPAIADVDGDGRPEIVLGFSVISADGTELMLDQGQGGDNWNANGAMTVPVDMDLVINPETGQREMELVAGNRVMKLDGTYLWDVSETYSDGYAAVADLDGDGIPEVVVVSLGNVRVHHGRTGELLWGPVPIPDLGGGAGRGGPPTIADFDGDGRLEFATAGRGAYVVFDMDCIGEDVDLSACPSGRSDGVLWVMAVQDISSSVTGSSVFDFDGDGRAEVVYNDECFLRVYDGTTGEVLYQVANSSRTGSENPIIVDVDGDFKAEIVVVSNNDQIIRDACDHNPGYPEGGTHGVFVYGDAQDNWVPTRAIWNQHTYHITNVNDDGTIPTQEATHYLSPQANSFRLNTQGEGLFNAPDLVVGDIIADRSQCPNQLSLTIHIRNDGSLGVPAGVWVEVRISAGGELLDTLYLQTTEVLLPGTSTALSLTWLPPPALMQPLHIEVTVDQDDRGMSSFRECREDNNDAVLTDVECYQIS